jgi:hypothetical protein
MITREEEDALCAKYARHDGMIHYRAFTDNCTLIQRDLEKAPLGDVWDTPLADSHPRNPLTPKVCMNALASIFCACGLCHGCKY